MCLQLCLISLTYSMPVGYTFMMILFKMLTSILPLQNIEFKSKMSLCSLRKCNMEKAGMTKHKVDALQTIMLFRQQRHSCHKTKAGHCSSLQKPQTNLMILQNNNGTELPSRTIKDLRNKKKKNLCKIKPGCFNEHIYSFWFLISVF